ncbi:uncharacterized protein [Arachis hypogaea]|uniref:uncharacterized protein n=1 Tax=Arachis hypogaea TaxID=3818 RepID=UPI003B21D9FB
MASSKQQGVKGKAVSVAVPTFTAIIKNGHKRLRPSSLQNSPSTPDCLGDTSKQQIGKLEGLSVEGHRQTGQQPDKDKQGSEGYDGGSSSSRYQGVGIVEANGHSGGIWVLCSNSNISVRVLDVVDQCISFEITMGNTSSYCSASEVRGGQFRLARAEQFAETLEDCGLFDMGAIGRRFTWYRKVKGGVQVAKKLDRAVINQDWRLMFPEAYTEVLARLHSDHCPLFTRCKMAKRVTKGHRPFRFQAAWMTHPLFRNIVDTAWNRGAPDVVKYLLEVQKDVTSFNKKVFGNIFVKKRELERLLNDVQITLESREDQQLRIKEQVLHHELNAVLLQEELLWYQKSREQWVRCGDINTKFFHLQTVIRRKRNKIHRLFLEDGS